MVRPLAADAKIVFGRDHHTLFERVEKPEVKGYKEKVQQIISQILDRLYQIIHTHKFRTDSQFCAVMDKEFKKLSDTLEKQEKALEYGGVDQLRPDLSTREAVQQFAWQVGEIVHKLQKEKGHSKEVDKFAKKLEVFFERNNQVMASDKKKIEAREGFVHKRGITEEEREYVKGKVAGSPIVHTPTYKKQILGGLEKRQVEAHEFRERMGLGEVAALQALRARPAIQKNLIGLGNALPKLLFAQRDVIAKLSDKQQAQLKEIMEGKLHALEPAELLGKAKQAIQLVNQGFFEKKAVVPKDVRKELDRIRDHIKAIEKELMPKLSLKDRRAAMKERGKALEVEMGGAVKRRDRIGALQSLRATLPLLVNKLRETKLPDGTSLLEKTAEAKQRRYLESITADSLAKVGEKGITETTKHTLKVVRDIFDAAPGLGRDKVMELLEITTNMENNLNTLAA